MKPLVIKPHPRSRRCRIAGAPVVAIVSLGYPSHDGRYRFPEVDIGTAYHDDIADAAGVRPMGRIKFQSHSFNGDGFRPSKGFLRADGYSRAYGGAMTVDVNYPSQRRAATKLLALLDRAQAATHNRSGGRLPDDDLLRLVLGLRLIGVEVRVYRDQPARRVHGGHGSLAVAS